MKYRVIPTNLFKRELRKVAKRGLPLEDLEEIVDKLANDVALENKLHDHALSGNYAGYRECHIHPDWLLIYNEGSGGVDPGLGANRYA